DTPLDEDSMPHLSRTRPSRWLILPLLALLLPAAATPAGDKKLPVPDAAALKEADKLVLEIFQEDIDNAKDAASRVKLAGVLMQQGRETRVTDNAAARYLLFNYARTLAAKGGD